MGYSSILKTDFYKVTHMQQYNTGITHFTSYLTPRGSRFKNIDKMVVLALLILSMKYSIRILMRTFLANIGLISMKT